MMALGTPNHSNYDSEAIMYLSHRTLRAELSSRRAT